MDPNQYLGSKISLISKSDVRYEGILYAINPKESTVYLQNGIVLLRRSCCTVCARVHALLWIH